MNELETPQDTRLASAPAHHLPMLAFYVGSAVSFVGNVFTLLAIPWFVLQTTGSVTQMGITAFFATLPSVLSAFFGSSLVDRLGYKRTSVCGDIASGLAVLLIPLLYHTIGLAFWQLLALVFLGGLLKSPGSTARDSMVPELAEMAGLRLERANAFSDGISRVAGLIGAPLAGVLIVIIGTSNLLWLDAASFLVSALLIGVFVSDVAVAAPDDTAKGEQRYLQRLWEGVRFIQHDGLICSLVIVILITNLIDGAFFAVIEPAYIKHFFNSALPFGLIVAAFGGAAFVGTMIFGVIGHRMPRRLTYGIGYMIGGAFTFWVFLLWPNLPVLIGWQIVAGLAISVVNPIFGTVMQERIPMNMRARVFGTVSAGTLAGIPLGTFISGFVVSWIGLSLTLLIMGALYLLFTLSLLVNPIMRHMERPA